MRIIVALCLLAGCDGQSMPVGVVSDTTGGGVQYNVTAPYRAAGIAMAGNDGAVYSVLPSSPLASDPWQLVFCYQADCLTMTQPLEFIPQGETDVALANNLSLVASGGIKCSTWSSTSKVSWYDGTPLHWHIAINAICADGTFAVQGDWQRVN